MYKAAAQVLGHNVAVAAGKGQVGQSLCHPFHQGCGIDSDGDGGGDSVGGVVGGADGGVGVGVGVDSRPGFGELQFIPFPSLKINV